MTRSSHVEQTYEVVVRINGKLATRHYEASSHYRAIEKAVHNKLSVVSVQKADTEKIFGDVKNIKLLVPLSEAPIQQTAIAMENIAFKRRERIENNKRDKGKVDY